MATSASSRVHKTLSLAERTDIINRIETKKESQESVGKHFGVHRSQISCIMKQKEQLLHDLQNNQNNYGQEEKTNRKGRRYRGGVVALVCTSQKLTVTHKRTSTYGKGRTACRRPWRSRL